MAWIVLLETQDHYGPPSTGEIIMKKFLAIAAMAAMCSLPGRTGHVRYCLCHRQMRGQRGRDRDGQNNQVAPLGWPLTGGHSGRRLAEMHTLRDMLYSPCRKMINAVGVFLVGYFQIRRPARRGSYISKKAAPSTAISRTNTPSVPFIT